MRRAPGVLLFVAMLLPRASGAVQLHWASGASAIAFSAAARCTLVVQADPAERRLPSQWRLLWVTDRRTDVRPVASPPWLARGERFAQPSSVGEPAQAADSAAHLGSREFHSVDGAVATTAQLVLDLPAGGSGRLKVVAIDPSDPGSSRVVESAEVVFNGGAEGEYPPVVLSATRSHPSSTLRVEAVGVGFSEAPTVEIAAPDDSWRLRLDVLQRSATALTAVARVAADLPPFELHVTGATGAVAGASLDADTVSALSGGAACLSYLRETESDGETFIQPKDFAIVAARDSFHVFYIRHDVRIMNGDLNEQSIGHQRSHDLVHWDPPAGTMIALQTRPGQWDNRHVWAPTIIKRPNDITYLMFYTGVRDTTIAGVRTQVQRIGIATSTDLNVWRPESAWVFSHDVVPWAEPDSTAYLGQQFRDPFVMADPDSAGRYLMFFVAGTKDRKPRMVVGVARSDSTLRNWRDAGPLWNTDKVHTGEAVIESPHAFKGPGGRWWLFFTGYNTTSDPAYVSFETDDVSPADLDTTRWSAPDTLYRFLGGDPSLRYWHGSEYLRWAPGYEYLLAYDDSQRAVDIAEMSWHGPHVFALNDSCAPSVMLGVGDEERRPRLDLVALGPNPARGAVSLGIEVPSRMRVRLSVYDVLGRRVRTLLDAEVAAGRRVVRWDGRGEDGHAVGSGVFFLRLTSTSGQRVARVVLIR